MDTSALPPMELLPCGRARESLQPSNSSKGDDDDDNDHDDDDEGDGSLFGKPSTGLEVSM